MRNILLFTKLIVLLFVISACRENDGIFCADVIRYNPKTNYQAEYRLKVEIEDHKLTKVYWPNQGYLDGDDFSPTLVNESEATFTDKQGSEYKIYILDEYDSTCFADVPNASRCKGITTKNKRCNNQTDHSCGFCRHHLDQGDCN